jgi:hypothetical protein
VETLTGVLGQEAEVGDDELPFDVGEVIEAEFGGAHILSQQQNYGS